MGKAPDAKSQPKIVKVQHVRGGRNARHIKDAPVVHQDQRRPLPTPFTQRVAVDRPEVKRGGRQRFGSISAK